MFPDRRGFTDPVLLPSQEVQDFHLFPRSNFLGRWTHLGTFQHGQRLARRPGRLPLQPLYQETFPGLVVQIQLVSDAVYPRIVNVIPMTSSQHHLLGLLLCHRNLRLGYLFCATTTGY